jgi:RNA methyltransferase, TrmH family
MAKPPSSRHPRPPQSDKPQQGPRPHRAAKPTQGAKPRPGPKAHQDSEAHQDFEPHQGQRPARGPKPPQRGKPTLGAKPRQDSESHQDFEPHQGPRPARGPKPPQRGKPTLGAKPRQDSESHQDFEPHQGPRPARGPKPPQRGKPRQDSEPRQDFESHSGAKPRPGAKPSRPGAKPHTPKTDNTVKVAGLPAVQALFARDPQRIERLFFDHRITKALADELCKIMAARHKVYRMVSSEELAKVAGTTLHGGIVAVASPKTHRPFDIEEAQRWARAGQPLIILDGISNPHNLGAIARTMAFFGLERLVISDHPGQALPSEAATRVAEGGLEWLDLYRVHSLPNVLQRLKTSYRIVGTALDNGRPLGEVMAADSRPLALVLGNEETGIPAATLAACEEIATIPGSGHVQSLNVSATAAILVWEVAKSRRSRC